MLKLQRNYRAEFEIGYRRNGDFIPQEILTIAYPFTCQLMVTSGTYESQNNAIFQFVNLSRNDQSRLWLDVYNKGEKYIYLNFYGGYGQNMPLLFSGFVQSCTSEKEGGSTEYITEVLASASSEFFRYGFLNATFTKGTTLKDILALATEGHKNVSLGYITPDIEPLPRNKTFIGQTLDLLGRDYGGYEVFINNGEINILGDRDLIPGEVAVISDESGLLGSPRRANGFVECDMIFEPQLRAGQGISLLSYTLPWLNQAYRIVRVQHKGVISPNISGKLITSVTLSIASGEMRTLKKATVSSYTGNATAGVWQKPVTNGRISSTFHEQRSDHLHQGIDIAATLNTPVYAPANGRIQIAGWVSGYGKCIYMDNGNINGKPVTSRYGHLNSYVVSANQNVYQGQIIGYVGNTGISTGPHLHFEIREGTGNNTIAVNPINYIGSY